MSKPPILPCRLGTASSACHTRNACPITATRPYAPYIPYHSAEVRPVALLWSFLCMHQGAALQSGKFPGAQWVCHACGQLPPAANITTACRPPPLPACDCHTQATKPSKKEAESLGLFPHIPVRHPPHPDALSRAEPDPVRTPRVSMRPLWPAPA